MASGQAWAGLTGKIVGKITDARTGEPLSSVSVVIVGSQMGAPSTSEGEYVIINIPPGRYTVSASAVGYTTLRQEKVDVWADLTTTLNFDLEATTVKGQEVTITAKRKPIQKDVTASTKLATGDKLAKMPVANFVGALATVGGAVGGGNNIHIRGGRRGEVAYLIDGMEVKDPIGNLRMLTIGSPAVAEMVAQTGGFDAEFGNAQSAVVNVVTKEGSNEYHGKLKYVGDDVNDQSVPKFENHVNDIYPRQPGYDGPDTTLWEPPTSYRNYDYFEASLGGPEPITTYLLPKLGMKIPGDLKFFIASDLTGRNANSNGVRIWSSDWHKYDMLGNDVSGQRREAVLYNGNYSLTYQITPTIKLRGSYRFNKDWYNSFVYRQSKRFPDDYTQSEIDAAYQLWTGNDTTYHYVVATDDDHDGRVDEEALNGKDDDLDGRVDEDLQPYTYNAPDHVPSRTLDDDQYLFTLDHTLSKTTWYTLKFSRYKARRLISAADKQANQYGEPAEHFTDLPDATGKKNGRYDVGEPFVDTDGDGIWDAGNESNNYTQYRGFLIQGDGTEDDKGQPVPYWLEEKSYTYGFKGQITSQLAQHHQVRGGFDYNYYDLQNISRPYPDINNGGKGEYIDLYHVYPADGALYAQDKMEFADITLTVGTRLDFYAPGEQVQHVKAFDTTAADFSQDYVPFDVPEKVKYQFSPRIGTSYSISEDAYLHAHYGHFYQRPLWDDIFTGVNQIQTGGTPVLGNPDLDPEKTVAFEVGVAWNPLEDYVVDVTGFMKDIKNWINTRAGKDWYPEHFGKNLIGKNFAIYDNQDYAFARGIEFNVSKEGGKNFTGRVTYTLSWVNAKNSYSIGSQSIRSDYVEPVQALAAGWDQRHSIVMDYSLSYGPKEPLFGITNAPGDWDFSLLWNIRSGLPYSPTDESGTPIQGQYMSKRTPWSYDADLNATKYFNVGKFRASLWFQVYNLFNDKNVVNVDDNYGRAGEPNTFDDHSGQAGWVNDSSSPNWILNRAAGPNPDAWDSPRTMRIGLGLDF